MYDKIRSKIKSGLHASSSIEAFKLMCAKLEVKLSIKNEELKRELSCIEKETFEKTMSTKPTDKILRLKYDSIINQLKYIRNLRNEFSL